MAVQKLSRPNAPHRTMPASNEVLQTNKSLNKIALFNQRAKTKSFRQALEASEIPLEHERESAVTSSSSYAMHSAAISSSSLTSLTSSRKVAWLMGKEAVSLDSSAPLSGPAYEPDYYRCESPIAQEEFPGNAHSVPQSPVSPISNYSIIDANDDDDTLLERSTRCGPPLLPALQQFEPDQSWFAYSMASPPASFASSPVHSPSPDHIENFDRIASADRFPELKQESYFPYSDIPETRYDPANELTQPDVEDSYEHLIPQIPSPIDDEDAWSDTSDGDDLTEENSSSSEISFQCEKTELLSHERHNLPELYEESKILVASRSSERLPALSRSPTSPSVLQTNFDDLGDEVDSLDISATVRPPVKTFKSRVLAAIDTHAAQLSTGRYAQPATAPTEVRKVQSPVTQAEEFHEPQRQLRADKETVTSSSDQLSPPIVETDATKSLDFSIVWDRFREADEVDDKASAQFSRPILTQPSMSSSSVSSSISSSHSSAMLFTEPPSPAASASSSASSLASMLDKVDEPHIAKESLVPDQASLDARLKLAAARDALKRVRHNVASPREVEALAKRDIGRTGLHTKSVSFQDHPYINKAQMSRSVSESAANLPMSRSMRYTHEQAGHDLTRASSDPPPSRSTRSSRSNGRDDRPIAPTRSDVRIGMSAPKNLALLAKGIPSVPVPSARAKGKGKAVVYKPQTHITSIHEVLT